MNQEPNYQPDYEQDYQPNPMPDPNRDEKIANTLCIISLACEIIPLILSGVFIYIFSELTSGDMFAATDMVNTLLGVINSMLSIAGLVLMIYVRVKYPKNFFGKFLMWLYIVMAIIAVVTFILYMLVIMVTCISCMSCMQDLG